MIPSEHQIHTSICGDVADFHSSLLRLSHSIASRLTNNENINDVNDWLGLCNFQVFRNGFINLNTRYLQRCQLFKVAQGLIDSISHLFDIVYALVHYSKQATDAADLSPVLMLVLAMRRSDCTKGNTNTTYTQKQLLAGAMATWDTNSSMYNSGYQGTAPEVLNSPWWTA